VYVYVIVVGDAILRVPGASITKTFKFLARYYVYAKHVACDMRIFKETAATPADDGE
jgi:hypothetical protein